MLKIETETFTALGHQVRAKLDRYRSGGGLAIKLLSAEDGAPIASATINVGGSTLAANEAVIKDYSENDGLLDDLVSAGVVADTGRFVMAGFIVAPVVRLL